MRSVAYWIYSSTSLKNTSTGLLPANHLLGLALAIMDVGMPSFLKRKGEEEVELLDGEEKVNRSKSPRKEKEETKERSQQKPARQAPASSSKSKDVMDELTLATAEVTLETKADQREASGYLQRTILVPVDNPMVVEGLEEARLFGKEIQKKRGANVGPGHVKIFLKAMKGLAGWKTAILDGDLKVAMEAFWSEVVMKQDEERLREEIQVFRIIKPKVSSKVMVGRTRWVPTAEWW